MRKRGRVAGARRYGNGAGVIGAAGKQARCAGNARYAGGEI
ncbi:MAG: hypothetical protein ABSF08_03125 [Candidatus Cybelea sp.]